MPKWGKKNDRLNPINNHDKYFPGRFYLNLILKMRIRNV